MQKVLIVICGSVAAVKVGEIIQLLKQRAPQGAQVRVVATEKAQHFLQYPKNLELGEPIITDADEQKWIRKGDPILHIELRRWADIAVLLPLSANTLGKIANGLADNLATAVLRAWPFADGKIIKPILAFPAMNSCMWEQPVTKRHLDVLKEYGYTVVDPIVKTLACGESGMGALCEVEECVEHILASLERCQ